MTYADRLRQMDTRGMTMRDIATALGCAIKTARVIVNKQGKPYVRLASIRPDEPEPEPDPLDLIEQAWSQRLRGREFDSHRIRQRAIARLTGPELTHTAGGTSAGTCADAGASYRPTPPERTRNEVRAGVRRLFETGATFGAIAEQLGLTRHQVSGVCYRMGLLRGNEKMAAVAARKRGE